MTDELISRTTRGLFRSLMTGSTVGEIGAAFQDEGFAPDPDCAYEDSSVRRQTTQAYLDAVDWADPRHVARALRVFGRLMNGFDAQYTEQLRHSLRRDGYVTDSATGHIMSAGPTFAAGSLAGLKDASAIREQLDRIQRAIANDPALAVGSAKELIESTAKVILAERGLPVSDKADLPELTRQAQQALGLHPSSAAPGPDSTEAVKRILGGVSTNAAGLAELRNRGYGTGHGAAGARVGLQPRHAHLAVNAAFTWCQLMIDTLADPEAPWRHVPGADQSAKPALDPS